MKKDKPSASFVNIGSSSLLIIFLILSLVTFAVLALSGAQSDLRLSRTLAERSAEYYRVSDRAEKIVAQIDRLLSETASAAADPAAYRQTAAEALGTLDPDGISLLPELSGDVLAVSFSIPFSNEEQALNVRLEVTDYTRSETYYETRRWQVVSTRSWNNDQPLPLLQTGE